MKKLIFDFKRFETIKSFQENLFKNKYTMHKKLTYYIYDSNGKIWYKIDEKYRKSNLHDLIENNLVVTYKEIINKKYINHLNNKFYGETTEKYQ